MRLTQSTLRKIIHEAIRREISGRQDIMETLTGGNMTQSLHHEEWLVSSDGINVSPASGPDGWKIVSGAPGEWMIFKDDQLVGAHPTLQEAIQEANQLRAKEAALG